MSGSRKAYRGAPARCPICGTQYAAPTGPHCGTCFLQSGAEVRLVELTREIQVRTTEEPGDLATHSMRRLWNPGARSES